MKVPGIVRGKSPSVPVFEVLKPQLSVRFWDLENDADVTGKTIPVTANITFRIDTNLDKALQLRYRPDMTSLDSFYTVSLMIPGTKCSLPYIREVTEKQIPRV